MSHNFEIKVQGSRACPQDKEGDRPLMGLTKNTNTGISEGADGNMVGKANGPASAMKVYSKIKGCRKQMGYIRVDGLVDEISTKSNRKDQKEARSTSNTCDKYSPVTRGNGLKEVAEWEEQDKGQHAPRALPNSKRNETCNQIKEVTSYWIMTQDLGVACGKGEESLITMMINQEERDKIEADRLGNKMVE